MNEILEYSKLQEKGISIEFAIVDLSALVMRIVSRFEPLMREQGIEIEQNIDEGCTVPKQEIVDNGYDLSINKYKQVEYVAVKYPPRSEIMAELKELEQQIAVEMGELEKLLKE